MAQMNPATPKSKLTKSANLALYYSPKKTSDAKPSSNDNFDGKSSSTLKSDLNESEDKSENSATTSPHVDSVILGPPPPSPAKRKRAIESQPPKSFMTSLTKKRRLPKRYAPPSTYAHLPALPDTITPNLLCLFVGLNPGIQTATLGHPYAHPSTLFCGLLPPSGLT